MEPVADSDREDLRQRRSKRLLSETLLAMMEEQPFQDISVVDLCQRAMVHRTTFYAHFRNKNDLLHYLFQQIKSEFQSSAEAAEPASIRECLLAEFRDCLRFLKHRQGAYFSVLSSTAETREVEEMVAESLLERFRKDTSLACHDMAESAAWFYAGGLITIIRWWLEQAPNVSEEELSEQVRRLLPAEKEDSN